MPLFRVLTQCHIKLTGDFFIEAPNHVEAGNKLRQSAVVDLHSLNWVYRTSEVLEAEFISERITYNIQEVTQMED